MDLTRASLGGIGKVNYLPSTAGSYNPSDYGATNPWSMTLGNGDQEDINWLI
jgi:hypothetical protein